MTSLMVLVVGQILSSFLHPLVENLPNQEAESLWNGIKADIGVMMWCQQTVGHNVKLS